MDDNPDYTTIVHIPGSRDKWVARRLSWDMRAGGDYVIIREKGPMSKAAAEGLAVSWAAVYQLEYRP